MSSLFIFLPRFNSVSPLTFVDTLWRALDTGLAHPTWYTSCGSNLPTLYWSCCLAACTELSIHLLNSPLTVERLDVCTKWSSKLAVRNDSSFSSYTANPQSDQKQNNRNQRLRPDCIDPSPNYFKTNCFNDHLRSSSSSMHKAANKPNIKTATPAPINKIPAHKAIIIWVVIIWVVSVSRRLTNQLCRVSEVSVRQLQVYSPHATWITRLAASLKT